MTKISLSGIRRKHSSDGHWSNYYSLCFKSCLSLSIGCIIFFVFFEETTNHYDLSHEKHLTRTIEELEQKLNTNNAIDLETHEEAKRSHDNWVEEVLDSMEVWYDHEFHHPQIQSVDDDFDKTMKSFDPMMELSDIELQGIQEKIEDITKSTQPKILIAWPSQTSINSHHMNVLLLNTIQFFINIGFQVDFIFWKDTIHHQAYDNTIDREKLLQVGVEQIFGPYDEVPLSKAKPSGFSKYFAFLFWIQPMPEYLECLIDFVNYIQSSNARTHIISTLADDSMLLGMEQLLRHHPKSKSTDEIPFMKDYFLQNLRHPDLVGNEDLTQFSETLADDSINGLIAQEILYNATYMFHLQMYLHVMSSVTLGIDYNTVSFLKKVSLTSISTNYCSRRVFVL